MNFKRDILPSIFSFSALILTVCTISVLKKNNNQLAIEPPKSPEVVESNTPISDSFSSLDSKNDKEMRAVWIPYMALKVDSGFSEENFKENYRDILNKVINTKLNAVIVQVRPFSDALYPSKIFPWSHILTGTQGKEPGFDPLKFMVEETHLKGIKFHAWVVPMRIKCGKTPQEFSNDNTYVKWKNKHSEEIDNYIIESGDIICYDPKYSEVRETIVNGVKEIVENYDVDGISFDDYFYPVDNLWVDKKSYNEQKASVRGETRDAVIQERKDSINLLISEVYKAIKSIKSNVVFGISPQGNFDNSHRAGADIERWAQNDGYVDYLCPEIYTNSTNPILPFEKAVSDWRKLVTCDKVKCYIGLGLYKTGTNEYDQGTWMKSDSIIMNQIKYLRDSGCDGFSLYSSIYLDKNETKQEVLNAIKIFD